MFNAVEHLQNVRFCYYICCNGYKLFSLASLVVFVYACATRWHKIMFLDWLSVHLFLINMIAEEQVVECL